MPFRVAATLHGPPTLLRPAPTEPLAVGDAGLQRWTDGSRIPIAWQAATAVLGLLSFGVIVGSLGGAGGAYAAGPAPIAYVPQSAAPVGAPVAVAATTGAAADPSVEDASTPADVAPPTLVADDVGPSDAEDDRAAATTPERTTPPDSGSGQPPIKHVFLIVLSGHGADGFDPDAGSSYLSTTLRGQGEFLSNYYAVAGSPLANGIALVSGQGPTPQTTANCPTYADVTPGTPGENAQVLGSGCVYPAGTRTIGDQLTQDGETWKTYAEDMGAGGADDPKTCRHPALGGPDGDAVPRTGDGYVTWRNPFMYFHSVIDAPSCAKTSVGLDQLTADLSSAATTPSLSYIVPSRSDDGSTTDVTPGQPGGLAATDTFLRLVVPAIQNSAAYRDGGLIAITFDGAPQTGDGADTSGCCDTPAYPNMPAQATSPGTAPTTPTTPQDTPAATATPQDTGAATVSPDASAPQVTTPGATAPAAAVPGAAAPSTGGGRVGLLLVSDYVKAGSTNLTSSYNHYSLLASVENLFGLDKLGYAAAPTLPTFDVSIFNGKRY